ncbi:hypothetical protein FCJ61_04080 [Burkholderia metallica]|uniref:hypothetical protein n=1 Tax=Burkholderia metallica TaxID=488729 RepID=UPI00157A24A0|nr:hypothetical protein [Burkholderia metallica]NTZ82216.1 hypothetical protein [Burkholderia metallica]
MDPLNKPTPEEATLLMLRSAISMMPQGQEDAIHRLADEIRTRIASDPLAMFALGLVGAEISAGVEVKA